MTDAYQPNDPLARPAGVPPEAEAVIVTPVVPATGTTGTTGTTGGGKASDVKDTAKQEAGKVKETAADAGRHVADTTKEEAKRVGAEAKHQARQLLDQSVGELKGQAKSQQQRAAGGVRTFGDDLRKMASGEGGGSGFAAQVANELSDRASTAAQWLEDREPADLLQEVQRFARRRPGTFIAIAGLAGLVVGRLASGIIGEAKDEREREEMRSGGTYNTYATGAYGTDTYATGGTYGTDTYGTGAGLYDTGAGVGAGAGTGTYGATGAETVDEEPWLGERPAGMGTGTPVDTNLPTQPGGFGSPTSRREDGL
ncbi:hypothetical protein [Agrococcus sp. DT81.2]|uniref:hypothetical protein n=1 Tax=Agrococcus sp. DT81.2 TaxID=3393414 RepID=UPI003CE5B7B7